MKLFVTKYWTYIIILSIICFLITVQFCVNPMIVDHCLEPLSHVNISTSPVHVKINSNISSNLILRQEEDQISIVVISNISQNNTVNASNYCSKTPSELLGKVKLVKEATSSFNELLNEFNNSGLTDGGHYSPSNCTVKYKIAIVVPYRDRFEHLNIFLRNIHPFLQRQKVDYTIFVIEQAGDGLFNRGMLMNIGFVEAIKIRYYDCFIFHDVDLLPEDDRNLYTCPDQPRHMSVAVDVFRYKLPYPDIFGGVCAMSTKHFQLVNGFSNLFWGWGGEDDDMAMRIKMKGLHLARYPFTIARYTMLNHDKQKASPKRAERLYYGRKHFKTEGLSSLEYRRLVVRPCKLFTWILVKLTAPVNDNVVVKAFKNFQYLKFSMS